MFTSLKAQKSEKAKKKIKNGILKVTLTQPHGTSWHIRLAK